LFVEQEIKKLKTNTTDANWNNLNVEINTKLPEISELQTRENIPELKTFAMKSQEKQVYQDGWQIAS